MISILDVSAFQSTCPMRGTTVSNHASRRSRYFNPRAPCGARPSSIINLRHLSISIHVPHAGHDLTIDRMILTMIYFNPRAPCGARLRWTHRPDQCYRFQSTCPMRGTTSSRTQCHLISGFQSTCPMRGTTRTERDRYCCDGISIHVPHAGHDFAGARLPVPYSYFNPRAPCGARLTGSRDSQSCHYFNPRAPCGARHFVNVGSVLEIIISIHVPHAGHDFPVTEYRVPLNVFQSTCPMRGTTHRPVKLFLRHRFQSTCPMRGTTCLFRLYWASARDFNPRAPCGARLTRSTSSYSPNPFQSTCPMRGTTHRPVKLFLRHRFQSTCPMRGTTARHPHPGSFNSISIHVPHAGHDGPNPKSETFLCSNLVSSSKISIQATCFCKTISEIQDFLGANVPPSEQQLPVRTDVFIFRPRICNPFTFLRVSVRLPDRRKYLFHSVRSGFDTCFPGCRIEDCLYQNHRYPAIGFSTQYTLPDPHHIEKQSSALFDHRIHRPLRFSPVSSVPLQLLYLRRTLSK